MRKKKADSKSGFQIEGLEPRNMLAADLISLSPATDSTGVDPGSVLVATYSENVEPGAGSGNFVIHNAGDSSVVEAINVNSSQVSFDGASVTIEPAADLTGDSSYYVTVDVGAVKDLGTTATSQVIFSEDFEGLPLRSSNILGLDDFVVVISGVLDVQTAGDYTFGGTSDDGQLLAIDVDQNGLDAFSDDQIIFDDTTHGNQDRLHTCGIEFAGQSCVDTGEEDAVTLAEGEYPFEYWFFDQGGGNGGEFYYASGYHEIFGEDFVLVGDASKGIGVTADGITATTYKSLDIDVADLEVAEFLIAGDEDLEEGYPVSAQVELANIASGGNFGEDFAIPTTASGPSEDWTDVPPAGWSRDNSFLDANRPGGQPEYNGWTFLNKEWWIAEQGDQARTVYENGTGTVAVVDPDAFDDFLGINSDTGDNTNECAPLDVADREAGGECGYFSTGMSTPQIYLTDVEENSAGLQFDSSWRDESSQSAELTAEYFDADGNSIGEDTLLRWESINDDSGFYKPRVDDDGNDAVNEVVKLDLNNSANANSVVFTFSMPYAQNDWWWAVDNIMVTANVAGEGSAEISDPAAWAFSTGGGGETLVGDIDGDGEVAFADFLILSSMFGQDVEAGTGADLDANGNVGFSDFLLLSNNFGASLNAPPVQAAAATDLVFAAADADDDADAEDDALSGLV